MAKEEFMHLRIDSETLELYTRLCEEHASNISAMTRKLIADWVDSELQNILQDMGVVYISSAELAEVLPDMYDDLLGKLEAWAADPSNSASDEDVKIFQSGQHQIEILFGDDAVSYTAGRNRQEISNQPPWSSDKWKDFLDAAPKDWLLELIK